MTVREILEQLLGKKLPDGEEVSIPCFDREDEHNSCSLNTVTGLWFDHAQSRGGNFVQAVAAIRGCSSKEALDYIRGAGYDVAARTGEARKKEPDPIDEAVLQSYVKNLFENESALAEAKERFGWTEELLKDCQIGWEKRTGRYAVPIRDEEGVLRNFRLYSPTHQGKDKTINFATGYGRARLYGVERMADAGTIAVTEGEKDCLMMRQVIRDSGVEGWEAVTGTGGAGTWKAEWNEHFRGKHVLVIYDRDEIGEKSGLRVAQGVSPVAASVRIVELDITEPKGADLTDYFMASGKSWSDFRELVESTKVFRSRKGRKKKDATVHTPHLAEASHQSFIGKTLQIEVMVAGKDLSPFAVPSKARLVCDMKKGPECAGCAMFAHDGEMQVTIDRDDPEIIKMIKVSEQERDKAIRQHHGIHPSCRRADQEVLEWTNVEETTLVPEIDFGDADREYVTRTGYITTHGIKPNMSYRATGTAIPHPKTQHVVHFFPQMEEAQDNIDDFEITPDVIEKLKIFQVADGQTVKQKFDEIASDLSANVTRIYGRKDLVEAVDLCYHSVLAFELQGKLVGKAWGDILIMGDTRTGKSETVESLMRHYRLGDIALGEDCTFAGLVGGLSQQSGGRWSLTWGRIPLNDRRLLVMDEASGLSVEDISRMSGIRSNGIAELTKIVTQRTMARTRLIWISNPRSTSTMNKYSHGVEAVPEIIGRPEDIARFDLVVVAASNEVAVETINASVHEEVDHRYTSDLCKSLILWAWSRRAPNVVISDEATEEILRVATEHAKKYASGIPLVEAGNHRIKVAKLAVAAACRVFSTDDGERVLVEKEHVEFAAGYMDECYSKPSMDYLGWSESELSSAEMDDDTRKAAVRWIRGHADWAKHWLRNDQVRLEDFRTLFDLSPEEARSEIFKPLFQMQMIRRGRGSAYLKTPNFITLLKEALVIGGPSSNGAGHDPEDEEDQEETASASAGPPDPDGEDFPF